MQYKYQMLFLVLCVLVCSAVSTGAAPAVTTWTAYLYEGPASRYAVIDEVPQETPVEVADCVKGWCRVTIHHRVGYMRAEVVAKGDPSKAAEGILPQPAAALRRRPTGSCVEANQTGGNGGNAPTVFCLK